MTLWNLIRDFFVTNIFGGILSNGDFVEGNIIGYAVSTDFETAEKIDTTGLYVDIGGIGAVAETDIRGNVGLFFGDWLSTTFTIITLILFVIFLYIFVKWIFKLFSGLLH